MGCVNLTWILQLLAARVLQCSPSGKQLVSKKCCKLEMAMARSVLTSTVVFYIYTQRKSFGVSVIVILLSLLLVSLLPIIIVIVVIIINPNTRISRPKQGVALPHAYGRT